ncbi:PH domain-containing protein [Streptomyces sp. NPDC004609]|uniref:PH domain-containing protein n=1 Tax=Streptomyces sp. NPDC004609 TaxID=3364704 RepID=UPI00369BA0B6
MSTSPPPAEPTYADRVFRSPAGMAGGVLLLALAAWLGGDALIRGEGLTPWFAAAIVLIAAPVVVAFTLRPAVFVNDDRVRIRNPFRTITLPWAVVEDVRAGYSSEIFTKDGTKYQLWAVPVSLRARKRANRQQMRLARDQERGRTPAGGHPDRAPQAQTDRTIAELRELAAHNAARPAAQGEPAVRWAYELAAPAAAGAVLLAVLLAIR